MADGILGRPFCTPSQALAVLVPPKGSTDPQVSEAVEFLSDYFQAAAAKEEQLSELSSRLQGREQEISGLLSDLQMVSTRYADVMEELQKRVEGALTVIRGVHGRLCDIGVSSLPQPPPTGADAGDAMDFSSSLVTKLGELVERLIDAFPLPETRSSSSQAMP